MYCYTNRICVVLFDPAVQSMSLLKIELHSHYNPLSSVVFSASLPSYQACWRRAGAASVGKHFPRREHSPGVAPVRQHRPNFHLLSVLKTASDQDVGLVDAKTDGSQAVYLDSHFPFSFGQLCSINGETHQMLSSGEGSYFTRRLKEDSPAQLTTNPQMPSLDQTCPSSQREQVF